MRRHWQVMLGVSFLATAACSTSFSMKTTLQTGLRALNDTVSPISEISQKSCVARQEGEILAVKAGTQDTTKAEENIKSIRSKCDELRKYFDQIYLAHNAAVDFVNMGYYDKATEKLKEIQVVWQLIQTQGLMP